jgi:hypothetical protein
MFIEDYATLAWWISTHKKKIFKIYNNPNTYDGYTYLDNCQSGIFQYLLHCNYKIGYLVSELIKKEEQ